MDDFIEYDWVIIGIGILELFKEQWWGFLKYRDTSTIFMQSGYSLGLRGTVDEENDMEDAASFSRAFLMGRSYFMSRRRLLFWRLWWIQNGILVKDGKGSSPNIRSPLLSCFLHWNIYTTVKSCTWKKISNTNPICNAFDDAHQCKIDVFGSKVKTGWISDGFHILSLGFEALEFQGTCRSSWTVSSGLADGLCWLLSKIGRLRGLPDCHRLSHEKYDNRLACARDFWLAGARDGPTRLCTGSVHGIPLVHPDHRSSSCDHHRVIIIMWSSSCDHHQHHHLNHD